MPAAGRSATIAFRKRTLAPLRTRLAIFLADYDRPAPKLLNTLEKSPFRRQVALSAPVFANGAQTAALAYALNELRSYDNDQEDGQSIASRTFDAATGTVDFTLSSMEAVTGIGIMIASPLTLVVAPGTFAAGTAIALHGALGMANSTIQVQNALLGQSNPGVLENAGGALFGDSGARLGMSLDVFTGIRPGAIASGGMQSFKDIYDVISTFNTMDNSFGQTGRGN